MLAGGAKADWSPQEDAELRGMVEQGGEGQWSVKAQAFSTNRSAGSLRHRWTFVVEQFGQLLAGSRCPAQLFAARIFDRVRSFAANSVDRAEDVGLCQL